MGYLSEKHGITMLEKSPKGTCEMCATDHDPSMPHNQQSLAYQYKFYDVNGRWPTWKDAMEHCTDEVKKYWIAALKEKGITV